MFVSRTLAKGALQRTTPRFQQKTCQQRCLKRALPLTAQQSEAEVSSGDGMGPTDSIRLQLKEVTVQPDADVRIPEP